MLFIPGYWSWLGETEVGLVVRFSVLVCWFLSNGIQNLLTEFVLVLVVLVEVVVLVGVVVGSSDFLLIY